jgi:hypothetical protein
MALCIMREKTGLAGFVNTTPGGVITYCCFFGMQGYAFRCIKAPVGRTQFRPPTSADWLTFGVFLRGRIDAVAITNGLCVRGCDLADVSYWALHG